MEPVTTAAAITAVVAHLAKKLKDNKSVQGFFDDFTEATVNWIKPVFIREDGSAKDNLKELQDDPNSEDQQAIAKSSIAAAVKKNPQAEALLQEMLKIIHAKDPALTQDIVINQHHSGSGDNVGRDKMVNSK